MHFQVRPTAVNGSHRVKCTLQARSQREQNGSSLITKLHWRHDKSKIVTFRDIPRNCAIHWRNLNRRIWDETETHKDSVTVPGGAGKAVWRTVTTQLSQWAGPLSAVYMAAMTERIVSSRPIIEGNYSNKAAIKGRTWMLVDSICHVQYYNKTI